MTTPPFMIQLDVKGKISYIDWNQIEKVADEYRIFSEHMTGVAINNPMSKITMGQIATLCIALREHILNAKIPDLPTPKKGNKDAL